MSESKNRRQLELPALSLSREIALSLRADSIFDVTDKIGRV